MSPNRFPVLFLGHGTPMNVLRSNEWTAGWARLGRELPRPQAILVVSAHWVTNGIGVTAMPEPRTIHDFGAFPQALFDVIYPAPGDPALAARIRSLLAPVPVVLDREWGLDHGSWSVLMTYGRYSNAPADTLPGKCCEDDYPFAGCGVEAQPLATPHSLSTLAVAAPRYATVQSGCLTAAEPRIYPGYGRGGTCVWRFRLED